MILQGYEDLIEKLARLEIGEPDTNENNERIWDSDATEASSRLWCISAQIRRTLWNGPYKLWAKELADRADADAARIGNEHKVLPTFRLPIFPGFVDGAGNFHEPVH